MKMKRILNVGCGEETYGTDRLDIIPRPNVTKVWNANNKLPYPKGAFDIVYARCLFEHLENPNAFLMECRRVLKKGGIIRIITDNAPYIMFHYNIVGIKHGDYCYDGKFRNEDMHFALYTPEHLRNHFNRAGLVPIKYYHDYYSESSMKVKIIQRILSFFFGKFGYSNVVAVGIKQ